MSSEDRTVVLVPKSAYGGITSSWPELMAQAESEHWTIGVFTRNESGIKQMPDAPRDHASFYNGWHDRAALYFRNW